MRGLVIPYKLRVKFEKPVNGWWDGGPVRQLDFEPERNRGEFKPRTWIKWGSWRANFWFTCKSGVSPKAAVRYAQRRLSSFLRGKNATIEILEVTDD